jgi:uncharacterized protein YggT (Ycf19 family)
MPDREEAGHTRPGETAHDGEGGGSAAQPGGADTPPPESGAQDAGDIPPDADPSNAVRELDRSRAERGPVVLDPESGAVWDDAADSGRNSPAAPASPARERGRESGSPPAAPRSTPAPERSPAAERGAGPSAGERPTAADRAAGAPAAPARQRDDRRRHALDRAGHVVDYVFFLLYGVLAIRFALTLMGASESAGFVQLIHAVSEPFYAPFRGLAAPPAGVAAVDFSLIAALLAYLLLHVAVRGLLRLLAGGPRR